MCGIFAYIGTKKTAASDVLAGLKLLEYRGYDSWGIAVKKDKKFTLEKHVGKIGNAKTILPASNVGIGHTRWATHGGVTVANAHPHLDCTHQLALVHNGIIENFQTLKQILIKKGHVFHSETDTEVAVHLIEEEMKMKNFTQATRSAFKQLKGFNAFVIANVLSNEIIAIKSGSPIVAGVGKNGLYVSSDVSGIVNHTREVIFLEDNHMVVLGHNLQLFDVITGKKKEPEMQHIHWSFAHASKGKFPNFMLKEIYDQPKIIQNIADNLDSEIRKITLRVRKAKGTFFIGAGTAYHAAIAGVYLFSKIAKKHVNTSPASEFTYVEDFLTKESLVIPLSQSGETVDVIEPLMHAKDKGSTIVSLVNTLGSTIYRMSDYALLLGAGPEKAVASTKVYTAKIAVLLRVAYDLSGKDEEAKEVLSATVKEISRLLLPKEITRIKKLAGKLQHTEHMYVIGRGMSYSSALEAALKIKEVSYIHTEGLPGGELKHGPIALIEKGTPCIVFAPQDETYDAIISNATEIKARGGEIIGISPTNNDIFDEWIYVDDCGYGSLIAQIVPVQILSCFLALAKHLDADKPRNLAKSVVVK